MVRASPSCAATATRRHAGRAQRGVGGDDGDRGVERATARRRRAAKRGDLVGGRWRPARTRRSGRPCHGSPVAGSTTLPAELTTTIAPTVTPISASVIDAVPTPPLSTPARAPDARADGADRDVCAARPRLRRSRTPRSVGTASRRRAGRRSPRRARSAPRRRPSPPRGRAPRASVMTPSAAARP